MAEGVPKYIAVRDNLRQRAQAMYSGEQLPPEPELCDQYGVSRITLRHAVDDLIQDGLLVREQGRGTFRTAKQGESQHEVISDHIRGFFVNRPILAIRWTPRCLTMPWCVTQRPRNVWNCRMMPTWFDWRGCDTWMISSSSM